MNFITERPDDRKKVKDLKWGKEYTRYIAAQANNNFSADWAIRYRNYRYVGSQLDQSEFQQFCDPFEWDAGKGLDYVQPFNKLHNVVKVLQGEELRRLFTYHVVDLSPDATNERLRSELRDYKEMIAFRLEKEYRIQQTNIQAALQARMDEQGQVQNPEQLAQMQEALQQELQEKENSILNLEEIKEKYKNWSTATEKAMGKLTRQFVEHQNIRYKKNVGFYDACVGALEVVRVELINGTPEIEVLNPLGVIFQKSPEIAWIQDGDYVGYKRHMSIKDIKKSYGDYLTDEDVKQLDSLSKRVYGIDARANSRDGESPSHFHQLNNSNQSGYSNSDVIHDGGHGYGNGNVGDQDMLVVYDCYWITERYVGLYTWMDEYGEEQAKFVDSKFKAPEGSESFTETDRFGVKKRYFEWVDEEGPHRLYYTWIPELWRGTLINENIFVRVEPMPEVHQVTPDNPYDICLPVYGATYNNRNTAFMSVVDYMMPWYKLYLVVMTKFLHNIAKDHGGMIALNTLFIGDTVNVETTMQYAIKSGFLPYNPMQNSQGVGMLNNMKAAEYINMSNMANIKYYGELALWIEREIFKAGGVPEQRLGQTAPGTNVSDNRQDMSQSAYITEPLFYVHELIWEAVLQSAVTLLAATATKNHPYVRDVLSDDEIAVIEAGLITKESRFRFKISNNGENTRIKQMTEQHLQALIQNDKANLSTFLKLLRKGEITAEMISEIEAVEKGIADREAALSQQQVQMQQQAQEMMIAAEDRKFQKEVQLKQMEIDSKERVAMIGTYARQEDKDADDNGVEDSLESFLALKDSQRKDAELAMKAKEMGMKNELENKKLAKGKSS